MEEQSKKGLSFIGRLLRIVIVALVFTMFINPLIHNLHEKFRSPDSYDTLLQKRADSIALSKTFQGQVNDIILCIIKGDSTKDLAFIESVHDRVQVETTERRDSLKSFYLLFVRYVTNVYTDFDYCTSAYYSGDTTFSCPWSSITLKQYDTLSNLINKSYFEDLRTKYDSVMNDTKLHTRPIRSGTATVSRRAILELLNKKLDVLKGAFKNHYEIIFGEEYPKD
jgi:hypothetical protein